MYDRQNLVSRIENCMMLKISFLEVRWAVRFAVDDSNCHTQVPYSFVAHGGASDLHP